VGATEGTSWGYGRDERMIGQGANGKMDRVYVKEHVFAAACSMIGSVVGTFGFRLRRPVFIIGTGRCGTSLLVRILNSHPEIAGYPGEANYLWHPKLEPFESTAIDIPPIEVDPRNFTEVSLANWPQGHGDRIRRTLTGCCLVMGRRRAFFTKSAMISFMIPKILEVFPDARFIHIYRSGPPVVESYFRKNYGKYSRFVFSEKAYRYHCARYWNDCILEIELRRRELSLDSSKSYLELSYENLCQNPRAALNEIAGFLDVGADGFGFDISRIVNQNYKVVEWASGQYSADLMRVMEEGMRLKRLPWSGVTHAV
jgi:hypothetical protein